MIDWENWLKIKFCDVTCMSVIHKGVIYKIGLASSVTEGYYIIGDMVGITVR